MRDSMKPAPKLVWLLMAVGALAAFSASAVAQTPGAAQIKKEIGRLEKIQKSLPASDKNFANVVSMAGDALKGASAALDAGQLYLSLEKVGQADNLLRGTARVAGASDNSEFADFESQYKKISM